VKEANRDVERIKKDKLQMGIKTNLSRPIQSPAGGVSEPREEFRGRDQTIFLGEQRACRNWFKGLLSGKENIF